MLIAPEIALGFPRVKLAEEGARRVMSGGDIAPGSLHRDKPGTRVSAIGPEGRLIAILELRPDRRLWPLRVLPE
jgi:hypothetical protein